jgi:hypothetical protein
MTTLTIPAAVIPRLREGAQMQLADGCDVIKAECEAAEKDEAPEGARAQMHWAWALIDALGWTGPVRTIELDVRTHHVALLGALCEAVPHLQEVVRELPAGHPVRAERAEELRALRAFYGDVLIPAITSLRALPAPLTIPAVLVERVRESAYGLLVVAASEVERSVSAHVAPEPDTRERFDRVWALLEAIGWSGRAGIELSITGHGEALLAAVEGALTDMQGWLDETAETDARRAERGDELRLMRQFAVQVRRAIYSAS